MGLRLCHREGCCDSLNCRVNYWPLPMRRQLNTHTHTHLHTYTPHTTLPRQSQLAVTRDFLLLINGSWASTASQLQGPCSLPTLLGLSLFGKMRYPGLNHSKATVHVCSGRMASVGLNLSSVTLNGPGQACQSLSFLICEVRIECLLAGL